MTQRFEATSGSARIVGEELGRGDSVIFLHAGVADRRMFRSQLQALGGDHRAVAYDRRGFGETTTPNEPFSHTEDLARVMRHLGIEKPCSSVVLRAAPSHSPTRWRTPRPSMD